MFLLLNSYGNSTSTSNLNNHLYSEHSLTSTTASEKTQMKLTPCGILSKPVTAPNSQNKTKLPPKYILARQLALFLARDNLPFNTVANTGFRDFCISRNIIPDSESMPSSKNIAGSALSDVYFGIKTKVVEKLKILENRSYALTFDAWTDNYRHLSYICITVHFIDDAWNLISCTLGNIRITK